MIPYFVRIIFTRSYRYLLLTFFSLLVGAFLFGAIVSLSKSVSSFFIQEGKTLIGGDVVLTSANKIDINNPFFNALRKEGNIITEEYGVQTVFRNERGISTVAANLRAVESTFPLYGEVLVNKGDSFKVGNLALYGEKAFLDKLGVSVGDKVYVGTSSFIVASVLLQEPDAVSLGVSFTPKVIIAKSDFLNSGIDLSQSRVSYKVLIKEGSSLTLSEVKIASIASYAKENKIRFDDARNGPNNFVRGLSSVQDFAGIVLAIALFLVSVNIGANLAYVVSRFKKTIALLKTFGATTRQIQAVYSIILGGIGFLAGFLGALLGAYGANMLLPSLATYVEGTIPATSLMFIASLGGITGLLLIIVSSLPFFNSLSFVSPKQLLSSIVSSEIKRNIYDYLVYLPIPLLLGVFLYLLSKDIRLAVYGVGGLVALFSFFMSISYGIITYLYKKRHNFSFLFSSILSFLKWRGLETIVITASVMTALSGVFIVSAVEQNIVSNIQQNISKTAPSLYLVDITKSELSRVREIAGSTFTEYAIIRGRLLTVNDKDMTTSLDRGVTREFNMTYRNSFIEGEKIIKGVWHGETNATNSVSFDKEFADQVGGVVVGDTVSVFIQGITVTAKVTSIREANRSRGKPFFYMVFSPDVLSSFPATYFGTVEESPETIATIERTLGVEYPNIIPIQTSRILETVNNLLSIIILVVKIIGIPSILLGLMLVLVMTGQSLYERKGDVLVLRVFGLKRDTIIFLFIVETGSLIFIASGVAYIASHIIAYIFNIYLFSFTLFSFAVLPVYISIGIILVTSLFAYFVSYSLVRTPLKKLLAEK